MTSLLTYYFLISMWVLSSCHTGLSSHLTPLSYDLSVKLPSLQPSEGFTASFSLYFNLSSQTENITLHAVNLHSFLNISVISFQDRHEQSVKSTRISKETVDFEFIKMLLPGEFLLTIGEYRGVLNNETSAVFHRNHEFYSTHFQPHFARQFLPCIDHPSVKASFRLSIIHPISTISQSNTIIEDVQIVNDKWQKTIFAPTPPLPTYLISFSVMPNSYIQLSRQTSFGVNIRVNSASYAPALRVLNIALTSFELLANIMKVPLPLDKINFILVPLYDGGMENWGHVLLSESLASNGDDAHLMYVVAHELAHHWVGGKATIKSWQYICLQEDLTDFLAFKVVRALFNEDRYNRFKLAKYVEIQLAEDFLSVGHSLIMPEQITKEMVVYLRKSNLLL